MPPTIGVAVAVFKDGKLLLGEDHGKGKVFALIGRHLEDETIVECTKREALEEAGIEIKNLKLKTIVEFYRKDKNKQYMSICFKADYASGKLRDEKEIRKNWQWYDPDNLPEPLFEQDKIMIPKVLD